jgi:hypothetical protein
VKETTPEQMAKRMAGSEPSPLSAERERAVRAHAQRIIDMTRERTGKTPPEIERILAMPHPECDCETSTPKAAHGTWICTTCGGIAVTAAAENMQGVIAEAIRSRGDAPPPNPAEHPKDDLGRAPVCFNKSSGTPVKCLKCEAEGKLIYAGFAPNERKIFCPRGHTKIPRSMRFTSKLLRRKKASA